MFLVLDWIQWQILNVKWEIWEKTSTAEDCSRIGRSKVNVDAKYSVLFAMEGNPPNRLRTISRNQKIPSTIENKTLKLKT